MSKKVYWKTAAFDTFLELDASVSDALLEAYDDETIDYNALCDVVYVPQDADELADWTAKVVADIDSDEFDLDIVQPGSLLMLARNARKGCTGSKVLRSRSLFGRNAVAGAHEICKIAGVATVAICKEQSIVDVPVSTVI